MKVNSIEELVESGISELQTLADAGNTVAQHWLERIQRLPIAIMKLSEFGEMRVTLKNDVSAEAKQVYETMFPEEKKS